MFVCELCKYSTSKKFNYSKHILTKKHHRKELEYNQGIHSKSTNPNQPSKPYQCNFCPKSYKYRQNKYRHQLKCPLKTQTQTLTYPDKNDTKIINQIETQNNTQNIQNNFNITINNYNTPDRSHLTDQDISLIIRSCNLCVPNLVKKTYFDKAKPENHSIYIDDVKDKYGYIYKDKQWLINIREELINELMDWSDTYLEEILQEWQTKKHPYYKQSTEKYTRYQDNIKDQDIEEFVRNKVEMILHNHKKLPKEMREKQNT